MTTSNQTVFQPGDRVGLYHRGSDTKKRGCVREVVSSPAYQEDFLVVDLDWDGETEDIFPVFESADQFFLV